MLSEQISVQLVCHMPLTSAAVVVGTSSEGRIPRHWPCSHAAESPLSYTVLICPPAIADEAGAGAKVIVMCCCRSVLWLRCGLGQRVAVVGAVFFL
jgi:hypothetical protein